VHHPERLGRPVGGVAGIGGGDQAELGQDRERVAEAGGYHQRWARPFSQLAKQVRELVLGQVELLGGHLLAGILRGP
jgi:hypothetical protein